MNKNELIKVVAASTRGTQEVSEAMINATLYHITSALASGDDVRLHGFGTFTVKDRAERIGRNPQTGEPVNIAASRAVKFKATKGLV